MIDQVLHGERSLVVGLIPANVRIWSMNVLAEDLVDVAGEIASARPGSFEKGEFFLGP